MRKTSTQGKKGNRKKLSHFSFKWKSGNSDFLLILMFFSPKLQLRVLCPRPWYSIKKAGEWYTTRANTRVWSHMHTSSLGSWGALARITPQTHLPAQHLVIKSNYSRSPFQEAILWKYLNFLFPLSWSHTPNWPGSAWGQGHFPGAPWSLRS